MEIRFAHSLGEEDILADGLIVMTVERKEVEKSKYTRILDVLSKFEACGKRGRGRLMLLYDGWNEDPRELYEVPIIRTWVHGLVTRVPHLFYWLSDLNNNKALIACSISDFRSVCIGEKKPTSQPLRSLGEMDSLPKVLVVNQIETGLSRLLTHAIMRYCNKLDEPPYVVAELLESIPGLQKVEL